MRIAGLLIMTTRSPRHLQNAEIKSWGNPNRVVCDLGRSYIDEKPIAAMSIGAEVENSAVSVLFILQMIGARLRRLARHVLSSFAEWLDLGTREPGTFSASVCPGDISAVGIVVDMERRQGLGTELR